MRTVVAGMLLAAAGMAPAHGQVSGEVTISNLRYHLIDLDPLDSIAPSIVFTLSSQPSGVSTVFAGPKYGPQSPNQPNASMFAPFSASAYASAGEAHVYSSGTLWNDLTIGARVEVVDSTIDNIISVARISDGGLNYVLSPHTAVQFASDLTVEWDLGVGMSIYLNGAMNSYHVISPFNMLIDPPQSGRYTRTLYNRVSNPTSDSFNNNVGMFISLTAVPEPSSWAMFALGALTLAGLRTRRRHTA